MRIASFFVPTAKARTTALLYRADRPLGAIILAHGAGAPQTHPWMVGMAQALRERGLDTVTFNFLYAEAKRRVPDRSDVLEETWESVIAAVRARRDVAHGRLFIGGKSMGGRIATQLAAGKGAPRDLAGLVLLGYPLHPPGKPDRLRAEHLPRVQAPMLFVQGSRDAFGTREELAPIVKGLGSRGRLFVVEGGDHSLALPKSRGEALEHTLAAVAEEVIRFTL